MIQQSRKPGKRALLYRDIHQPSQGFGFVQVEEAEGARDIFIPEESVGSAFHGDRVQVVVTREEKEGKRCEGTVAKVLERGMEEIVGTYEKSAGFGFVVPDNQRFLRDIFIPQGKSMDAENRDKVLVKIKDFGSKNKSPGRKGCRNTWKTGG